MNYLKLFLDQEAEPGSERPKPGAYLERSTDKTDETAGPGAKDGVPSVLSVTPHRNAPSFEPSASDPGQPMDEHPKPDANLEGATDKTDETQPPVPMPWRAALAALAAAGQHARREVWGRRANELEAAGHGWRDAERLAFAELEAGELDGMPPALAAPLRYVTPPPADRPVWYLRRRRPVLVRPRKRGNPRYPRDATHWCLEGASAWEPLDPALPRSARPKRQPATLLEGAR
jgi:hypothetical protein